MSSKNYFTNASELYNNINYTNINNVNTYGGAHNNNLTTTNNHYNNMVYSMIDTNNKENNI